MSRIKFENLKTFSVVLIFSCLSISLIGQNSLDDFQTLQSKGKMPEIFMKSTQTKVEEDMSVERSSMDLKQKTNFLQNIHYHIDELLHSGLVLYGDPATKFVQKVADKLLSNNAALKKKLQFYVIKSNVTNALSTDQGIIFVTLGLLAQIENEAQLAYVLSHEIAHFQQGHVEESYNESTKVDQNTSYDNQIIFLSNHSKANELEADKLGIKLYHAAGYAKSELLSTFNVLIYSYLPFDEDVLPKDYFNNSLLYIPESYFPEEINAILVDEDYDDNKSSHPNIRKRKEAIIKEIKDYSDWGDLVFSVDREEFNEIRNLARFESVRLELVNCSYANALYSIFLLEQDYPGNRYLAKCKAQAFLGLASFKLNGSFSITSSNPSKVEGESHAMHYFLRKLSKIQLISVAMRIIEDARLAFPDDLELIAIHERMIGLLASYSRFKVQDYRKIDFVTALERFEKSKIELLQEDSLAVVNTEEEDYEEQSKYDKIIKKRTVEEATNVDEEFDYEKFHIYALSDLIGEKNFSQIYDTKKEEFEKKEDERQRISKMTARDRKIAEQEKKKLAVSEIILIEPSFYTYYYGDDLPIETLETRRLITESVKKYADKFAINIHDESKGNTEKQDTRKYNDRVFLLNYLRQRGKYDDEEMFPVDYTYLQKMISEFNDAKLLFAFGIHKKTKVTNSTQMAFLLLDLKTGEVENLDSVRIKKPKKFIVEGIVYNILSKLNHKASK